jgi:hypothetical protein
MLRVVVCGQEEVFGEFFAQLFLAKSAGSARQLRRGGGVSVLPRVLAEGERVGSGCGSNGRLSGDREQRFFREIDEQWLEALGRSAGKFGCGCGFVFSLRPIPSALWGDPLSWDGRVCDCDSCAISFEYEPQRSLASWAHLVEVASRTSDSETFEPRIGFGSPRGGVSELPAVCQSFAGHISSRISAEQELMRSQEKPFERGGGEREILSTFVEWEWLLETQGRQFPARVLHAARLLSTMSSLTPQLELPPSSYCEKSQEEAEKGPEAVVQIAVVLLQEGELDQELVHQSQKIPKDPLWLLGSQESSLVQASSVPFYQELELNLGSSGCPLSNGGWQGYRTDFLDCLGQEK